MYIVWCILELKNSSKKYKVSSKRLETEEGDPVTERDLYYDNKVIWVCQGQPYEATIFDFQSEIFNTISVHVKFQGDKFSRSNLGVTIFSFLCINFTNPRNP